MNDFSFEVPILNVGRLLCLTLPVSPTDMMVFVIGTYLIAPVSVFGVLLSAMGFAQAQHGLTRLGYLVLFFVVQVMGWRLWLVSVN